MKFLEGVRGCPANIFCLRPFLINSSLALVLGSVNCPAEVIIIIINNLFYVGKKKNYVHS